MTRQSSEQLGTALSTATTDRYGTITATYRRLRILGFDECEAGNLTAYINGVAVGPQPWTVRELGERKPLDPGATEGRVTLLTLFHGMSGPGANLDHLAPPGYRSSDALRDRDPEGG